MEDQQGNNGTFFALRLPDLDGPILAARGHRGPIRRPVESVHLVVVPRQRLLGLLALARLSHTTHYPTNLHQTTAVRLRDSLALAYLPELERAVLAGADEEAAVGCPGHHVHGPDVAHQRRHEAARAPVPDLDLLVERGAGDVPAVGREGQVVHDLCSTTSAGQGHEMTSAACRQTPSGRTTKPTSTSNRIDVMYASEPMSSNRCDRWTSEPTHLLMSHHALDRLLAVQRVPEEDGVVIRPGHQSFPTRGGCRCQTHASSAY